MNLMYYSEARSEVAVDVNSPITTAIPTLDGPVLAVLAGSTTPLTLTEIHRIAARGSLTGVRKVLLRLEGTGLVHRVPGGYVLNREHIAAPAVEQLAQLHGVLAERIRTALGQWEGTVLVAGMFGSAARHDGDALSDIDILIVSDSRGLEEFADTLAERVQTWTGNEAHVVTKTTSDLKRLRDAQEPIVQEWERSLLVLAGDRRALKAVA